LEKPIVIEEPEEPIVIEEPEEPIVIEEPKEPNVIEEPEEQKEPSDEIDSSIIYILISVVVGLIFVIALGLYI